MTTTLNLRPSCTDWRTLYRGAILDTQPDTLRQRIAEAEEAAIKRRREIFYDGGSIDEKEALEDALYILHAFITAPNLLLRHAEAV